jgi:hypothetical protein
MGADITYLGQRGDPVSMSALPPSGDSPPSLLVLQLPHHDPEPAGLPESPEPLELPESPEPLELPDAPELPDPSDPPPSDDPESPLGLSGALVPAVPAEPLPSPDPSGASVDPPDEPVGTSFESPPASPDWPFEPARPSEPVSPSDEEPEAPSPEFDAESGPAPVSALPPGECTVPDGVPVVACAPEPDDPSSAASALARSWSAPGSTWARSDVARAARSVRTALAAVRIAALSWRSSAPWSSPIAPLVVSRAGDDTGRPIEKAIWRAGPGRVSVATPAAATPPVARTAAATSTVTGCRTRRSPVDHVSLVRRAASIGTTSAMSSAVAIPSKREASTALKACSSAGSGPTAGGASELRNASRSWSSSSGIVT